MSDSLDAKYWENRYVEQTWGWDIGYPSPALIDYASLYPIDSRILIPGCGHAYEAEWLWNKGYKHITLLDVSRTAKQNFLNRVPDFPEHQFIVGDFFGHDAEYDIILEQTFYCALAPEMRDAYVSKMSDLLVPNGRLAGVLFTFPLTEKGPPFGGSQAEYQDRFGKVFEVIKLAPCYNSIPPREGNEVFIEMKKPE